MELEKIEGVFTVCRVPDLSGIDLTADLFFIGRTDEEISLVCRTEQVPEKTLFREDGWKTFRVRGILDLSMTGILSKLSGVLAEQGIAVFAVSTFNTDYLLVKEEDFDRAVKALSSEGFRFV